MSEILGNREAATNPDYDWFRWVLYLTSWKVLESERLSEDQIDACVNNIIIGSHARDRRV